MRRCTALLALLLAAACSDVGPTGPPEVGYQRIVAGLSFCDWILVLPAGMQLDGGAYDVATDAGAVLDVPLSAAQLQAIRTGAPARFFAWTRAPFTVDVRLRLRADTTYTASWPTLVCRR